MTDDLLLALVAIIFYFLPRILISGALTAGAIYLTVWILNKRGYEVMISAGWIAIVAILVGIIVAWLSWLGLSRST